MLRGLVDAEVEFVVVGGVAAVAHGSTSVTNDLDICYHDTSDNIRRLSALLRQWKAYPRDWERGQVFSVDARTIKTTPTLNLQTSEGLLDVLAAITGLDGYVTALRESEEMVVFGLHFRVLGLAALIRSKEAAGRTKDLAQLPTLRALLELKGD
jgi:predicted nucleotidyltransferase